MPSVVAATPGAWFADTATKLTPHTAARLKRAGFAGVLRYISLGTEGPGDLDKHEVALILDTGLQLGVVQHVRFAGWHPDAMLGVRYGDSAAKNMAGIGALPGMHTWLDFEEPDPATTAVNAVAYTNAWSRPVMVDWLPGLYVGFEDSLFRMRVEVKGRGRGTVTRPSADVVYADLILRAYWRAGITYASDVAVRGFCMYQHAGNGTLSLPISIDRNQIAPPRPGMPNGGDNFGQTPMVMTA